MDFDSKFDHKESQVNFSTEKIEKFLLSTGLYKKVTNIQKLMGGYSHFNFSFESENSSFVLRISSKSLREFEAENSVLENLSGKVPIPKVVFREKESSFFGKHIAIQEFVPGQLLSVVEDEMDKHEIVSIGAQLGEILAKIHSIEFKQSGFLGKNMVVEEPFLSFQEGYFGYIDECLKSSLLKKRLGLRLYEKLNQYIQEYSRFCDELSRTKNLTHSDFNQKNILVAQRQGKWEVTGIMDWEFAYSGCPLSDFGNFFRYEDELPAGYRDALVKSYLENGGQLDKDWREKSRYLDLLPMMSFLIRESEHPRTFRTAKRVIEKTVINS